MPKRLTKLLEKNRQWAKETTEKTPDFFEQLSKQQAPKYLWIGCADSRVPATEICGLQPGEIFVHRNVANVVVHTDLNCLSVLQYAVQVLKVEHIIVCGHYGCGGVLASMQDRPFGMIDNWLRNIKDVYRQNREALEDPALSQEARADRLCELNVAAQVANVCHTTIVQDAWRNNESVTVHGWIYGLRDGLLKDLDLCLWSPEQLEDIYRMQ